MKWCLSPIANIFKQIFMVIIADIPWEKSETSSKELRFKDPNEDNIMKVDKTIS